MRDRRAAGALVLAAVLAVVVTGCTGRVAPEGAPPLQSPSTATGAPTSSASSPTVPNPFTIVARYSASSLGFSMSRFQSWGQKDALGLAVGPDGNVYVTEASERVTVVSPGGRVLRTWGKEGTGPGQFDFATNGGSIIGAAIAVGRDGKVYVADTGNHRIEVFSPAGRFIRQFGSFGDRPGQFLDPESLAVDAEGAVYVGDSQNFFVSKFSPTGSFQWRIGGPSSKDPYLSGHLHLGNVDSHDRVVVANEDARRIGYLDSRGRRVDVFELDRAQSPSFTPCLVVVDTVGYMVVVSCPEGPTIDTLVYDRTHGFVGAWFDSHLGSISFGPRGEFFALADDGSMLKLKVALPGA
jgi:DNA-binding beta-propeller fold protein YncE